MSKAKSNNNIATLRRGSVTRMIVPPMLHHIWERDSESGDLICLRDGCDNPIWDKNDPRPNRLDCGVSS